MDGRHLSMHHRHHKVPLTPLFPAGKFSDVNAHSSTNIFFLSPALQLLFLFSFKGRTHPETGEWKFDCCPKKSWWGRGQRSADAGENIKREWKKRLQALNSLFACKWKILSWWENWRPGQQCCNGTQASFEAVLLSFHFTWFRSPSLATVCGSLNPFQTFGLHSRYFPMFPVSFVFHRNATILGEPASRWGQHTRVPASLEDWSYRWSVWKAVHTLCKTDLQCLR